MSTKHLILAWVALMATGISCATPRTLAPCPDQSQFAAVAATPPPGEPVVQLRCAKIPWLSAVHCWFAVYEPPGRPAGGSTSGVSVDCGGWHRWEVWQTPGADPSSWGHLRRDLMAPDSGVGAGGSWVLAEWRGEPARRLHEAILASPGKYGYRHEYHYWPGPNSNTYVRWVLKKAGVPYDLPPGAFGKNYPTRE